MSRTSTVPKLLQLVFVTKVDRSRHELNLAAPEVVVQIPSDIVYNCITRDFPLPCVGMTQIYRLEDLIWWHFAHTSTGDLLALRFADCGSELTEEETAFAKPFHDIAVGEDKTVDYEALFQKLATNLK